MITECGSSQDKGLTFENNLMWFTVNILKKEKRNKEKKLYKYMNRTRKGILKY